MGSTADEYIPTGRTSLVKETPEPVQVQTEYALNPSPRITTTVSLSGRVTQKVEMKLKRALASEQECKRAEAVMNRQHQEVLSIIRDQKRSLARNLEEVARVDVKQDLSASERIECQLDSGINMPLGTPPPAPQSDSIEAPPQVDTAEALSSAERRMMSVPDRLRSVAGIEYIFHLDNAGNFFRRREEVQFKKLFRKVAKSVPDLVEIFSPVADSAYLRESGVYEVERDRLYLISTGEECFFVTIIVENSVADYERALRDAVALT